MKRRLFLFLAFLLALSVSNAWAEKTYWVEKGDTLSKIGQKYKVSWLKIQKANGLKSTKILVGQQLFIPVAEKVKEKEEKAAEKWIPGSAPTKEHLMEAVKKLPSFRSLPEKQQWAIYKKMLYDEYLTVDIPNSWVVNQMTAGDRKGNTRVIRNRVADLSKTGPLKAHLYRAEGVPVEFVHVLFCNNIAVGNPISTPKPPEITKPPVVEVPPTPTAPPEAPKLPPFIQAPPAEPALPPIFKEEKTRVIYDNELNAGAGLWQNQDSSARGAWWFAQYKLFLHNHEKEFAGGTLTPVVGAFARGDLGKTDQDYSWWTAGVGPMAGVMWNGITSSGYPQQVQVMIRAIYEYLHGQNSSSGYNKDEQHALVGYYIEYLRRFHRELMWVFYSEGWVDVSRSFTSTWSGDHASNRTQFVVGAKLHKDWSENWATRLGLQLGYAPEDNTLGANTHLEFRYNDWLIFGPSLDYNIISNIAAGGWAYGPFARVELHKFVIEKYSTYRSGGVKPADHQLLKY